MVGAGDSQRPAHLRWHPGAAIQQERGGLEAARLPEPHLSIQPIEKEEKGRDPKQKA